LFQTNHRFAMLAGALMKNTKRVEIDPLTRIELDGWMRPF
jgi:hypothetical protein